MLARLARWLRLLGADVLYDASMNGNELLQAARKDHRRMLTRDKRFRTALDVIVLRGNDFRGQLREVLARVPIDSRLAFTRCSRCNLVLESVPREVVQRRVPPFVYASCEQFAHCAGCARVYWAASHHDHITRELQCV